MNNPANRLASAVAAVVEQMETRRLLVAGVDGQTFGVRGTAGDDVISIELDETAAVVNINGDVTNLVVAPQLRMRVFLDAGDDTLTVTLTGRSIPATVYGGAGDDSIDFLALDERLLIFAKGGDDTVSLQRSLPTTPTALQTTVYGGAGNDMIEGSRAPDLLFGEIGNDTMSGNAQRDTLFGGDGRDSLGGGLERDIVRGQAGNDTISGGDDVDSLEGNGGDDHVAGNDGNDRVGGGDGIDDGAGNDTIVGGAGNDSLWDGQGSDLVIGGPGNDSHFANQSNVGDVDTSYGNGGSDDLNSDNNTSAALIDCGDGDDRAFARGRAQTILGGAGNDTLRGSFNAADSIDGGAGDDYIAGEFSGNVQDPTADSVRGGAGRYQFFFDEFVASEVRDYTHGEDVDPYLSVVLTLGREDVPGQIQITGRAGPDRVTIEPDPNDAGFFRVITRESRNRAPVTARFPNDQLGQLNFSLGSGDDVVEIRDVVLLGTSDRRKKSVQIQPGAGNDVVRFNASADGVRFEGGRGDDVFESNFNRGGPKTLYGGPGRDRLVGGASNDSIDGGGGDDTLLGYARADRIFGGEGNDLIDGGSATGTPDGADTLEGGQGSDTISGRAAADRIYGFVEVNVGNDATDLPNTFQQAEVASLEARDYREGVDLLV